MIGATNWLLWVCEFSRCFKDANEFSGFVLHAQNQSDCYGYWGLKEKKRKKKECLVLGDRRRSELHQVINGAAASDCGDRRRFDLSFFYFLFFFLFAFLILDP